MGSCSRLLQGGVPWIPPRGGGGQLSDGLRLGVLGLLDDGLELSTEGSSLGVVQHGDLTGQRIGGG
jgi:hypothetical protein